MKQTEFTIPVTWEQCGYVKIPKSADITTLEEALNYVKNNLDNIPLPIFAEYIDGSFNVTTEDLEEIKLHQKGE